MSASPEENIPDSPFDGTAKDYVLSQYLCAERILGFIDSNSKSLDLVREILVRMYVELDIDQATGQLLDRVGNNLGVPRVIATHNRYSPTVESRVGLQGDDHYRRYIKAQVLALFSEGDPDSLQAITRAYLGDVTSESNPFSYESISSRCYQIKVTIPQGSTLRGDGSWEIDWDPQILADTLSLAAPFDSYGELLFRPPGSWGFVWGSGLMEVPCSVGGFNNSNPVFCMPKVYALNQNQRKVTNR